MRRDDVSLSGRLTPTGSQNPRLTWPATRASARPDLGPSCSSDATDLAYRGGRGDLMTDRRAFLWGLAGAALPWSMAAAAQTPAKARTIGLLMTTTPAAASHI